MSAHLSSPTNAEKNLAKALQEKRWIFKRNQIVEGYEVDFLFPEIGLTIEVDGFSHLSEKRLQLDLVKENHLIEKGYLVLRFSNQQIREKLPQCLQEIEKIILLVTQGRRNTSLNNVWKERLRQIEVKKEEVKPVKKKQTIEEYFLSKEE